MAHPSPPAPPSSWLILSGEARVSSVPGDAPFILPHDAGAPVPSRISVLTLSPRLFHGDGGQTYDDDDPSIIAVDPSSGLLLLRRYNSYASPDPSPPSFRPGATSFVLDVRAITASRVPGNPHPSFDDGNEFYDFHTSDHLGIIAAPGPGGGYMIADLRFETGGHDGTLTRFFSDTSKYLELYVGIPRHDLDWKFNGVVSHRGKLWWVDKANGLLYCNPFRAHRDMTMDYVLLPNPKNDDASRCSCCRGSSATAKDEIASRRRVQVVKDKFRCAHITCPNAAGAPTVSMRTLRHPDSASRRWTLKYKLRFADIWDSDSYKAKGLPRHHPVLALIHPTDPNILYFGLDGRLFSVHARRKELIDCETHQLRRLLRSNSLIAWVPPPPPAQSAGFHKKGSSTSNGSREESAAPPA